MIDLRGMISIPFLDKSPFTGSEKGMCFRLYKEMSPDKASPDSKGAADGQDPPPRLCAAAWPGPFSFANTADEKKIYERFPFDKDGLEAAIAWLNRTYAEKFSA